VDPQSLIVTAKITVPDGPRFTTVGGGSVWVLSQSEGSVSRIDPVRNKVVSTIKAGVPGAGGDIAYGGDRLWVAAAGTPLTRIDPQSNQVLEQYGNYKGADAVRFGFGSVWVSDHGKGDVWRIDPSRILSRRNFPDPVFHSRLYVTRVTTDGLNAGRNRLREYHQKPYGESKSGGCRSCSRQLSSPSRMAKCGISLPVPMTGS
jgi:hypothetical protein